MHLLGWVDNKTLIACQCLLAALFGAMLLALRKLHPQTDGIRSMSLGCFFGVPATILLAGHGHIPLFASVLCASLLAFLSYLCLYSGLLRFWAAQNSLSKDGSSLAPRYSRFQTRRSSPSERSEPKTYVGHLPLLCFVFVVAFCMMVLFTEVTEQFAGQIAVISVALAVARGLMALAVFRNASGRIHLLLFASSLTAFSGLGLYRAVATLIYGAPTDLMRFDPLQTFAFMDSLVLVGVNGLFIILMINVSATETVEQKAQVDPVTGTLNRLGLEKALQIEIERAHRRNQSVAILLIELNQLRQMVDHFGPEVGEQALRGVARCLSTTVRAYDTLGRFSDDEFMMLLPDTFGDQGMFLAARLRQAVRSLPLPEGVPELTLSIGVTHTIAEEETEDIFKRADAALSLARQAGNDCARLQSPPALPLRVPFRKPPQPDSD